MPCQVALVRETSRECDLGQRKVGPREQLLSPFDAPPHEVVVWRYAGRLLELPSEMEDRQPGNRGELREFDAVVQMRFDILAHTAHRDGRQTPARLLALRLRRGQTGKRVGARPRVQSRTGGVVPGSCPPSRRRDERRPRLVAAGDNEPRGEISRILAPEEPRVSFKQ